MSSIYVQPKIPSLDLSVPNPAAEQLLASAKFSRSVQEKLYKLFFNYSYPSEYLNAVRFRILFERLINIKEEFKINFGLTNKIDNYFYAFDLHEKNLLNFSDFLLGKMIYLNNSSYRIELIKILFKVLLVWSLIHSMVGYQLSNDVVISSVIITTTKKVPIITLKPIQWSTSL